MKRKDLTYLLLAAVILLVAGYLGYTQLYANRPEAQKSKNVVVETVGVIPDTLDSEGLARIGNKDKARVFDSPVDLSGLNNQAPFGQ